jgi:Mn-containing catalase
MKNHQIPLLMLLQFGIVDYTALAADFSDANLIAIEEFSHLEMVGKLIAQPAALI